MSQRLRYFVRVDKNGTKIYEDWTCTRCGGAGGADAWVYTGFTCWECGGTGKREKPRIIKEYTPEYEAKLMAQREKAHQKKLAEAREKAPELNAEFFKRNGFDAEGNMWIVLGNSYDIKDELKALGCKFSSQLSCWHCDHELEGHNTIKLNASEMYDVDEAGIYLWQYMKNDDVKAILRKANENLDSKASSSSYVGAVGDKIEIKVTMTGFHSYVTKFNWQTIHHFINLFTDEAGNVFVWNTTACSDVNVGDHITIKGTIKGHKEYKGIKQTELQRCKITKEVK